MVSKIDWQNGLYDVAAFLNVTYLEADSKPMGGIKERHPRDLVPDVVDAIDDLKEYKAQVETARLHQTQAERDAQKAQNEARDKGFEIEDLEYQNRVLKALIWTLGFDLPVRTVVEPDDLREALEATKDFEVEVYHDPAKNEATLTFLPKSEYRSPMEGIGWHNFESKED